jgi:hypothetical protein
VPTEEIPIEIEDMKRESAVEGKLEVQGEDMLNS